MPGVGEMPDCTPPLGTEPGDADGPALEAGIASGEMGDGGALPSGIEPGIVLGIVVDDDGGGIGIPGSTRDGRVVLGSDDGDTPLGDTVLGTLAGDDGGAPELPGPGTEPIECGAPGLPRLGGLCWCGGRGLGVNCARAGEAP